MNFTQRIKSIFKGKRTHVVVTVTGGMGAQIISAAVYFSLRNEGRTVYADLSYFDKAERIPKSTVNIL